MTFGISLFHISLNTTDFRTVGRGAFGRPFKNIHSLKDAFSYSLLPVPSGGNVIDISLYSSLPFRLGQAPESLLENSRRKRVTTLGSRKRDAIQLSLANLLQGSLNSDCPQ